MYSVSLINVIMFYSDVRSFDLPSMSCRHQVYNSFVPLQVKHTKLVNARYCDRFPIVKWRDGRVVHVQVTPELHRDYERKMTVAVNSFHQRYSIYHIYFFLHGFPNKLYITLNFI